MSPRKLRFAGWMSFAHAVGGFSVPLWHYLYIKGLYELNGIVVIAEVGFKGVALYVLWALKKLLNTRFYFRGADTPILVLMAIIGGQYLIESVIRVLIDGTEFKEMYYAVWLILSAFAWGIAAIVLAVRLKHLNNDLFGLQKWYRQTLLAFGICWTSILLIAVGLFLRAVNDTILGVIFLRAARESNETELAKPTLT